MSSFDSHIELISCLQVKVGLGLTVYLCMFSCFVHNATLLPQLLTSQLCHVQMQERAPLLVRANRSDFSGRFSVIEEAAEQTSSMRVGPSPVAGAPLWVPQTSSQDEVVPTLALMSPTLSAEGHSSFELSHL